MYSHLKATALGIPLLALTSLGSIAQTTAPPAPPVEAPPAGGIGAWITGHPITDTVVVLAIVILLGSYFLRPRSRA